MWLVAASGGWVFHAGPSRALYWIRTNGSGALLPAGLRGDDTDAMNGVAAVYDVGKILTAGGAPQYDSGDPTSNAFVIDISAGPARPPTVRRTGSMNARRAFHNSVVLPTGDVVVVGGQDERTLPFHDRTSVLFAEIWSPTTEMFTPLAPAAGALGQSVPRTYHSVALLLHDGRVFVGGGGACGPQCSYNHMDYQLLTPPYLLNPDGTAAARPTLASAPRRAAVGASITVTSAGAAAFAIVRTSSATHSVNTDQRRVPLAATPAPAGGAAGERTYQLAIPSDTGVVVPGDYLLFALGPAGTPSVALTITISTS
jgi:galactose oxidase